MINRKYLIPFLLLLTSILPTGHSSASPDRARPARRVVLISVPALSLDDLTSGAMPNLRKLAGTGSIGLMNSRTAGWAASEDDGPNDVSSLVESAYVTIGSGARASAGRDARYAFNAGEVTTYGPWPARVVAGQRVLADPGGSEVVHIGVAKLTHDNSTLSYDLTVGALGNALHSAGLKTAVVGNSDNWYPHREIAAVCMDSRGFVDYGNVGPRVNARDPQSPFCVRTSGEALLRETARCMQKSNLTVVELGDLSRLEGARSDMLDLVFERARSSALMQTDQLLGRLARLAGSPGTRLVIFSPLQPAHMVEKTRNTLCPILYLGGGTQKGLLVSGSTQVPGVVTNADILPSVLDWLGVSVPSQMVGRPILSIGSSAPVEGIQALNDQVSRQTICLPILRQVTVLSIAWVVIATLLWIRLPANHRLRKRVLPVAFVVPSTFALSMILMALIPSGSMLDAWLKFAILTSGISVLAFLASRDPMRALMYVSLALAAVISVDVVRHGSLCRFSVMAYSLAEGARYYGVGNEIMGAFTCALMIGLMLALGRANAGLRLTQVVLLLALLLGTAIVGAPSLGTNMGGAIAVVCAFGAALAVSSGQRPKIRHLAVIAAVLVAMFAVFAFIDSRGGQAHQSHLGRALGLAQSGGLAQIGLIIERKLAMNLLLIRISAWSRLILVYALSMAAVIRYGGSIARPIAGHLRTALVGAIGGIVAALVFNDSGIVAAATGMVYVWSLVMLMVAQSDLADTCGS